jgi:hypothetical protein
MIACTVQEVADRLYEAGETETQPAPLPVISPANVYCCATYGSVVAQRAKTVPRGRRPPLRWFAHFLLYRAVPLGQKPIRTSFLPSNEGV